MSQHPSPKLCPDVETKRATMRPISAASAPPRRLGLPHRLEQASSQRSNVLYCSLQSCAEVRANTRTAVGRTANQAFSRVLSRSTRSTTTSWSYSCHNAPPAALQTPLLQTPPPATEPLAAPPATWAIHGAYLVSTSDQCPYP